MKRGSRIFGRITRADGSALVLRDPLVGALVPRGLRYDLDDSRSPRLRSFRLGGPLEQRALGRLRERLEVRRRGWLRGQGRGEVVGDDALFDVVEERPRPILLRSLDRGDTG